jgi:hypothetical protein
MPEDSMVIDLTADESAAPVSPHVVDLTGADVIDLTDDHDDAAANLEASDTTADELFSKQCHITNYDRTNLDNRNVVIPYDAFVTFLDSNFVCKICFENKDIVYERQTCGIASSINMVCSCGAIGSIKARMRTTAKHKKNWDDYTLTRLRAASEFELNVKYLMGLQQCGAGENDAAVYAGMLDLAASPIHAGWTKLEEEIGLEEIQLGGEIIAENIELEKSITPESETVDGRVSLSVQGDTRWDRRSSGHAYNSDSGASIMVGNHSSRVVALECMSKRCRKCELGLMHETTSCPKNYQGSSKGMEAVGALRNVQKIWDRGDCYVGTYVMDDDSTTRAVLCHPYKEMLRLGRISEDEVPKKIKQKPASDNGQLWLDHPKILPLADKNHRGKNFAKKIFQLANAPNGVSSATKNDAERIKRNFNFWCRLYWHETEEMFKWRSNAVIEHHFNDHRWCDPEWCAILNTELAEKKKLQCKYRSKLEDMAFYVQAKKALAIYTSKEALRDLRHGFHSNKCESLNSFITKALPKNKHTCLSNVNRARSNVIVGIDSLGYEQYYKRLFSKTGLAYTEVTRRHHKRIDKRRFTQAIYKKKPESKRKRRRLLYEKIAAGNAAAEESRKEGYDYGPGLMAPQDPDEEDLADGAEEPSAKPFVVGCQQCGKSDHKTTRSMKCYYSTNVKSVFFSGVKDKASVASVIVQSSDFDSSVVDLLGTPTPGIPTSASVPSSDEQYDSTSGK